MIPICLVLSDKSKFLNTFFSQDLTAKNCSIPIEPDPSNTNIKSNRQEGQTKYNFELKGIYQKNKLLKPTSITQKMVCFITLVLTCRIFFALAFFSPTTISRCVMRKIAVLQTS